MLGARQDGPGLLLDVRREEVRGLLHQGRVLAEGHELPVPGQGGLAQGLGVGVISSVSYALAIRHLDTPRCSAIGSMAPALACLGAVPLLGESLTLTVVCGIAAITAGVILANRA